MRSWQEIGTALPCVNWAGGAISDFVITLLAPIDYTEASLASGGKVKVGSDGKSFTFDLADDADALILLRL